MQLTGSTILVTGGATGIGRGLAEAFHARGNRVVIAGRRQDALDAATRANPGMASRLLDLQDRASIGPFAARLLQDFPDLDTLVNNAGIMRAENLRAPLDGLDDAEATLATNLLGPIRLTAALLPHLLGRPRAAILNVSSGLAFLPLAATPTYCATKAALHSYTESLRHQLRDSAVRVQELIPPYVATDLMDGRDDPRAMPLDAFIGEVLALLEADPDAPELCVERVKGLRFAAAGGAYAATFAALNDAMGKARS